MQIPSQIKRGGKRTMRKISECKIEQWCGYGPEWVFCMTHHVAFTDDTECEVCPVGIVIHHEKHLLSELEKAKDTLERLQRNKMIVKLEISLAEDRKVVAGILAQNGYRTYVEQPIVHHDYATRCGFDLCVELPPIGKQETTDD